MYAQYLIAWHTRKNFLAKLKSPQPKQVEECRAQIESNVPQVVRSAPPNTMPVLPLRHLKRTQPPPPPNQGGHKGHGAFARDVLRNQEELRRAACSDHLPHCSIFSKNVTILSPCISFQPWQPKQGVVEAPCLEDASARPRQDRC